MTSPQIYATVLAVCANLISVLTLPQVSPHNKKEIGSMVALCHTAVSILHHHHIQEEEWP